MDFGDMYSNQYHTDADLKILKRINESLARSLGYLRSRKELMDYGVQECSSEHGIMGATQAAFVIPKARDALDRTYSGAYGENRISEYTYDTIKREIDEIEDYAFLYSELFSDHCKCKRKYSEL